MDKKITPIISLLSCGFLYALYGPLSRIVGADFAPVTQIFLRTLMQLLILLGIFLYFRNFERVERKNWKWLIIMGFCGSVTTILYIVAVTHIAMGTTMFLFYAFSTIVSYVIGKLIFFEKITKIKIISLILAIIGLLTIFSSTLIIENIIYMLLASISGLSYGIYSSFSKKVSFSYSKTQILFIISCVEIVIYLFFCLVVKENSNFNSLKPWLYNLVYTIVVVLSMYLMVFGFKYVEAQKASILLLSELIFVIIFGVIFYQEIPTIIELIGGILILVSLIIPNINLDKKRNK